MARSSWEESLAGSLLGLMLLIAIVVIVVTLWVLVKACELVLRVTVAHPTNRVLWVAWGSFLLFATLATLTVGKLAVVDGMALLSGLVLVVVAKAVETYYDPFFMRERTKDDVMAAALHEPWWSLEFDPTAHPQGRSHELAAA